MKQKYLLPPVHRFEFHPDFVWVGAHWRVVRSVESPYRVFEIYICLVPMLPFHLRFEWGWDEAWRDFGPVSEP